MGEGRPATASTKGKTKQQDAARVPDTGPPVAPVSTGSAFGSASTSASASSSAFASASTSASASASTSASGPVSGPAPDSIYGSGPTPGPSPGPSPGPDPRPAPGPSTSPSFPPGIGPYSAHDDDGAGSALSAAQFAAARRMRHQSAFTRDPSRPSLEARMDRRSHVSYTPRAPFSNSVGHFGRRGEPIAGVPPELDPRASNFRPPTPSAASIYSVSAQAPASPPATVDDETLHHPQDGDADDEDGGFTASQDNEGVAMMSETESLRGLSPPLVSPSSTRAALTPASLAGDRAESLTRNLSLAGGLAVPGYTSASYHPPSPALAGSLARLTFGAGTGHNLSTFPLRSTRFATPAPASAAATIGSEPDSRSIVTNSASSDSRPSSVGGHSASSFDVVSSGSVAVPPGPPSDHAGGRDPIETPAATLPMSRPRSSSLQSESTASSSYGVSSTHSGTDSPYGDHGTSFAGTSIGATSVGSAGGIPQPQLGGGGGEPILEEAEQRTNVSVSVAPSEAGSGADASELNAPPASYASSLGYMRRSPLQRTASSIDEEDDDDILVQDGDIDVEYDLAGGDGDSTHNRANSIGVGSFGATPPGHSRALPRIGGGTGVAAEPPLPLPLSFGPGLAAFRSAQPTRAPSTVATAGTASPPRSETSATSDIRPRSRSGNRDHADRRNGDRALANLSDDGDYVARSDSEQATAGSEDSEDDGTDTEQHLSQTPPRHNQSSRSPYTPLSYTPSQTHSLPNPHPLHARFGPASSAEAEEEGPVGSIPGSWIGTPSFSTRPPERGQQGEGGTSRDSQRLDSDSYGYVSDQYAAPFAFPPSTSKMFGPTAS